MLSKIGEFERKLMAMIVEICNIQEPLPGNFCEDSPLTGPDSLLGLDSLDALEIMIFIQKRYGVRIDNQETGRKIVATLKTLSEFIRNYTSENEGMGDVHLEGMGDVHL